jgi:ABC-type phosphate/phosphonate transport system permease subunit
MLGLLVTWTMWAFHGLEKSRSVEELFECAVWTASQLLTGGSSLQSGSALGHALEVILELWAITVVAALAASVAAFLMQKDAADRQATERGTSH